MRERQDQGECEYHQHQSDDDEIRNRDLDKAPMDVVARVIQVHDCREDVWHQFLTSLTMRMPEQVPGQ